MTPEVDLDARRGEVRSMKIGEAALICKPSVLSSSIGIARFCPSPKMDLKLMSDGRDSAGNLTTLYSEE
jgi:hypothetical protein